MLSFKASVLVSLFALGLNPIFDNEAIHDYSRA
nr:MAG TPA: hypothetical protein [Caudoviricetes sp.]